MQVLRVKPWPAGTQGRSWWKMFETCRIYCFLVVSELSGYRFRVVRFSFFFHVLSSYVFSANSTFNYSRLRCGCRAFGCPWLSLKRPSQYMFRKYCIDTCDLLFGIHLARLHAPGTWRQAATVVRSPFLPISLTRLQSSGSFPFQTLIVVQETSRLRGTERVLSILICTVPSTRRRTGSFPHGGHVNTVQIQPSCAKKIASRSDARRGRHSVWALENIHEAIFQAAGGKAARALMPGISSTS
jgi:hypothetical protein